MKPTPPIGMLERGREGEGKGDEGKEGEGKGDEGKGREGEKGTGQNRQPYSQSAPYTRILLFTWTLLVPLESVAVYM